MAIQRFSILSVACCVALSLWTPSATAQELDVRGPLAGAPAVMRMRIYREGRFHIQPFAAMTLQDEYTRAVIIGAQLTYHFTDWLGVGLWGGFAPVQLQTSLTDEVAQRGSTNERNTLSLPSRAGFPDQIAKINSVVAAQATFIPLRGKLGLFEKLFVDTDFYLFGGAAFVGLQERSDIDSVGCQVSGTTITQTCLDSQRDSTKRTTVAPTFGAGLSLYITDFLAMSIEWRALPFSWNTSGTDEAGDAGRFADGSIDDKDRLFHFNHMVSLGFAVYLPFEPTISHSDDAEEP